MCIRDSLGGEGVDLAAHGVHLLRQDVYKRQHRGLRRGFSSYRPPQSSEISSDFRQNFCSRSSSSCPSSALQLYACTAMVRLWYLRRYCCGVVRKLFSKLSLKYLYLEKPHS